MQVWGHETHGSAKPKPEAKQHRGAFGQIQAQNTCPDIARWLRTDLKVDLFLYITSNTDTASKENQALSWTTKDSYWKEGHLSTQPF